jgi:hypothetical protein
VSRISRFPEWGAGSCGSGCPRGGRVDGELFEVFSSIPRRGRSLTQGRCQRYWSTLLTRFRRGCLLGGLAAETTRRMIAIPLVNRSFSGSRSSRWRCWVRVPLADPDSPGSVSGRGSTTDEHSVRISAAKLNDYARALREVRPDCGPDCLGRNPTRFVELT